MEKKKILIVDDEKRLVSLVSEYLQQAGYRVVSAYDGKEALSIARLEKPDLIILDLMMPEMNGHVAVSTIRRDSWGKNAKVIYLTNMTDAENVVNAVEHGSSEYIIKSNMTPREVVNHTRVVMRG